MDLLILIAPIKIIKKKIILYRKRIKKIVQNSFGLLIKSAYRSSILNEAITGKANDFSSQHVRGYAIDIVSQGYSSSTVWNWCYQNLPTWYQLIWEYPERGDFTSLNEPCSWVHISYIKNSNSKTASLSSKRTDLHEMYKTEKTINRGEYTHNITHAYKQLI